MVKDIFQELRLDVPNIEKHITPNMLCLRDIEVMFQLTLKSLVCRHQIEKQGLKCYFQS